MADIRTVIYKYGLLALFALIIVFFFTALPAFGTLQNLYVILQSVAVTAIVALGVTVSMTVGGFDLAVGSTVSLSVMVVAAAQIYHGLGIVWAVVLGLAAGLLVGFTSGALIVYARIPDMLATLGSMFVYSGLSLILTAGKSVSTGNGYNGQAAKGNWDPKLLWIGTGTVFSIPFSIILAVVATIVVVLFLGRTRTGRILEAVGNNPRAARLAGVRTGRYRILAYMISGLLSALGGIVLVARVGRGDINVGSSYLLEAVAATLIGYAVLGANRPNPLGTAVGALFVGVVVNGLTMFNVPYFTQDFIKGALLVVALIVSFSKIFNTRQQED
ncbi:ABC transporter permease [Bifidobacterium psychraerophilum]|jgi:simple sugar transport system permease protein|uniref:ABC transporter, permease n=1 Tax=Bifidobacterium psychraerophilum TaxID=218140 RepID=A0A087CHW9_9BIFI|nr:ABC transporter permease [Bifidobacterium psychraerophilum]KFI82869.1 ABC transporter, permease [Bifidobacterium psychraerophilum]MCI1660786.1 ABC transporter permease [Bifidobacterium psychraerophilum]MCI1804552.1 ABC transporter permease [Bifidobacterium psychraerophilum]MCI2176292.1 ABC transporter permease [Bifidobacterium psychraerophilum]MCI2181234.1 ABC transporter permease [Bifidobacterium psychraerophilum]